MRGSGGGIVVFLFGSRLAGRSLPFSPRFVHPRPPTSSCREDQWEMEEEEAARRRLHQHLRFTSRKREFELEGGEESLSPARASDRRR